MTSEELFFEIEKLGVSLNDKQKEQLILFGNLLLEYNKKINITAIRDINMVYLKHFYDSLTLVKALDLNSSIDVLDIGSGGGFPGIVLAIAFSNLRITLLDSNHKKSEFQQYIVNELKLDNVLVINDRAENFFKKGIKYDLVVARAVAYMTILSELCLPFIKSNGLFVAMKGIISEEIKEAEYAINFLGGRIEKIIKFDLPVTNDERNLVLIKKISDSPSGYPRSFDRINKKPLLK